MPGINEGKRRRKFAVNKDSFSRFLISYFKKAGVLAWHGLSSNISVTFQATLKP